MKKRTCLTLVFLALYIFMFPAVSRAWEDFPSDDQRNYLDYSDDDDDYSSGSSDEDSYYGYDDSDSVDNFYQQDDADSEEVKPVVPARLPPLEPGAPIKLEEKSIRFGRIPYKSLRYMMTRAVPLLRFLQKETGAKEVRLVSNRTDYASVLDALARGSIDFAWVGPTAYMARRDKDRLMPVAKAKFGSTTAYRGVFIAPAKGKVQGLEDLKGALIGFVDPESASGYIYPLYLLLRLGINPHTQSRVAFLHNHDDILRAVLAGKLEAGACLEETLNALKTEELKKKVIILAKTSEIPSDVIVCRQDCPINLRESFLKALQKVDSTKLPGSPTFMPAFDEDFESVAAVMAYIDSLKTKE